jgi:fused signal recognition particle receptor
MSEREERRGMFGKLFGGGKKDAPAPQPPREPELPEDTPPPQTETAAFHPPIQAEATEPDPQPEVEKEKSRSWWSRLTSGLSKTSGRLTDGITGVFTKRRLDEDTLEELEDVLIQADLGLDVASRVTAALRKSRYNAEITPEEVRAVLAEEVAKILAPVAQPLEIDGSRKPHVILVVGVNGTGKTTTIGKYANQFGREGKRVMLAAGDTFRAAAIEQLKVWGTRTGAAVEAKAPGADAAGLAFEALQKASADGYDVLLIDTAGRLQNKAGLMAELEKVVRVIRKLDPEAPHSVILTLDATTGQNALNQVEIFGKTAGVTGLVMTKLDGTARGGILVAIATKYGLPVHAIGVGEGMDDIQAFDANEFAAAISGAAAMPG